MADWIDDALTDPEIKREYDAERKRLSIVPGEPGRDEWGFRVDGSKQEYGIVPGSGTVPDDS